ncbi:M23 family metallopeptidase [Actinoplanes sp. SE50/110]|uniref:M23 family metallopeptidase n=1 Tax=Actinoplanes sp. (strain ATCC 31044 / CBS 674.73 / SE50/110) TaxID=134676 RepID=UPI000694F918|nr:M23 family metallopeptidase [Actinoplanes sp. SE50/110]
MRALDAFLRADPQTWPRLAPALVARAGEQRLREVVDEAHGRLGGITGVIDTPDGLAIEGPQGQVLAWAETDEGGALSGLWIAGARRGRVRSGRRAELIGYAVPYVPMLWGAIGCWTARSVLGWAGLLLTTVAMYTFIRGLGALPVRPWWANHPLTLLFTLALASTARLPRLTAEGGADSLIVGVVLVVAVVALLVPARRHRWPESTERPLAVFPVDGDWYVLQGGGRLINHHATVPEQRGAVDLVRIGPQRGDASRLESYLAYGEPVVAPCAGRVVTAVDGIEDQAPGTIRFAPPYGNRVTIDNGSELVTVAHLKPGTVTVRLGDTVEAGQLIGAVGNSGNSSMPHLHLQADRAGVGLQLRFACINGSLYRGRRVRAPKRRP